METTSALQLLDDFAGAMVDKGVAAVPADLLRALVELGRSLDVSPIALAVLADPTEPPVVRERAYAKVAVQIIGRSMSARVATISATARPLAAV